MSSDPAATAQPRPRASGWRGLHTLMTVTAVLGLVADQVTKAAAVRGLSDGSVVPVLDGWLSLRLLRNSGAAFSVGEGITWLFTLAAVVVVVVILRVSRRLDSRAWALTLGLLLAGAVGNLADRVVRQPGPGRGHVVDFIDYNGWFVGNVADILIVAAAAAVALLGLRGISLDGTRHHTDDHEPTDEPTDELRHGRAEHRGSPDG